MEVPHRGAKDMTAHSHTHRHRVLNTIDMRWFYGDLESATTCFAHQAVKGHQQAGVTVLWDDRDENAPSMQNSMRGSCTRSRPPADHPDDPLLCRFTRPSSHWQGQTPRSSSRSTAPKEKAAPTSSQRTRCSMPQDTTIQTTPTCLSPGR